MVDLGNGRELEIAVLLGLEGGRPVSRESILKRIWRGDTGKLPTLHSAITRLRNRLEAAGVRRSILAQRNGMYTLAVGLEAVDWRRFVHLCTESKGAQRAGDVAGALAKVTDALALWTGTPFDNQSWTWALGLRSQMEQAHQSALEQWARLALRTHDVQPCDVADALAAHTPRYPLNERLTEVFMLALHQAGRTSEAVMAYHTMSRTLSEESGTNPGPDLQRTLQSLLKAEPAATPRRRSSSGAEKAQGPPAPDRAAPSPPRLSAPGPQCDNLRHDIPDFSGRHEQLELLLTVARTPSPTAPRVHVVSGMPGVGKSTLAIHCAHLLRDDFTDGRFHLELHGSRPQSAKGPLEALHELLLMVGVPAEVIPSSIEARTSLWRDRTSGRRALLLLDDAADAAQVRPLLPSGSGWMVVITSRNQLAALEGARVLRLPAPGQEEAIRLFADISGRDSSSAYDHYAALAETCDNLPLALRIVAIRWRQHPSWPLSDVIRYLRYTRDRISELRAGDHSLEAVFRVSLDALDPATRSAFLRLGLHPAPEFGVHAAAALIGTSARSVIPILEELLDASLIEEPSRHRYTMHDLLSEFARRHADVELSRLELHSTRQRVFDHYLESCRAADHARAPHRYRLQYEPSGPVELPDINSLEESAQWFSTERSTLLAMLRWAQEHGGFERYEAAIAHALADLIDTYGPWELATDIHRRAHHLFQKRADQKGQAHALFDLGKAYLRNGDPTAASGNLAEALRLWSHSRDRIGEAQALDLIGLHRRLTGRFSEALAFHQQAARVWEEIGHSPGIARNLEYTATCRTKIGAYNEAIEGFASAIEMYAALGDIPGQAGAKNNAAHAFMRVGRLHESARLLEEAIGLLRALNDRRSQGKFLGNLALIHAKLGNRDRALGNYADALELHRSTHDRWSEVDTMCETGQIYLNQCAPSRALDYLQGALDISGSIGEHSRRAEILVSMGDAYRMLGQRKSAERHYSLALTLAQEHGHPEADILTRLTTFPAKHNTTPPSLR
ncbi:AfsR/SARP family transcriptional regulator [Nocardiopsis gilva]|nr:BTAD domain-containing putative transcriptional regulator [Nocardiopsis gilva]